MQPNDRRLAVKRAIDAICLKLSEADPNIDFRVSTNIVSLEQMRLLRGNCQWDNCGQSVAIFCRSDEAMPKLHCVFHSRGRRKRMGRETGRAEHQRTGRCPRPDKYAWGTYDGASAHLYHMRTIGAPDAGLLRVYKCRCGYYHIGRPRRSG